jgi:hypothetical protein
MPKNTFQDIIKIKIVKSPPPIIGDNFPEVKEKKRIPHNTLWFVALISVIFLFFAVSFIFSNATVTINPKTKDFTLDKTLTAVKNTDTAQGLTYDLVVLSGEEQKTVLGGEEKDWEISATGTALIYNAFSSSPQPLAINTRLEGSNGKIYKTKTKVVVPSMLKNVPGKVEVDIYGEKAGSDYNSGPLDFKVLGFKGNPKYSKIYARSVGDITGGLSGKSSQVSDDVKASTYKELKDTLFTKLFQKAKDQTPADFILLKDAAFLNINEEDITPAETAGSFILIVKGTFNGILFNKDKLEKEAISESLAQNVNTNTTTTNGSTDTTNTSNPDVYVSNIENLSISSFNKTLITLDDMKDITFNLSGTIKIIWKVDENKMVADLLGKSKNDFNQMLSGYQSVDSASMTIKPIWENSFPTKSAKIKIIVNYPK